MNRYSYVLEQLHRDDFRRLRAYAADQRCSFSTWVSIVARRLALDLHRQTYGRSRGSAPDGSAEQDRRLARRRLLDLAGEEVADPVTLSDPDAVDPEGRLRAAELTDALEAALRQLTPRDRLLLKLRFDDDLSAREIATIVGYTSPFEVYRRVNTLCASLRRSLAGRGVEDPVP
jgi:RNA polymerase sigma factor (sigma-70 family)